MRAAISSHTEHYTRSSFFTIKLFYYLTMKATVYSMYYLVYRSMYLHCIVSARPYMCVIANSLPINKSLLNKSDDDSDSIICRSAVSAVI